MAAITSSAANQGMSSITLSSVCEIFGIDNLGLSVNIFTHNSISRYKCN